MDLIFFSKHFRTEARRWGFLPILSGSSLLPSEATLSPSEEVCPPEVCLAATPRLLVRNFLSTLPDSGAAGLLPLVRPSGLLWMAWQAVEVWPPLPPWPQLQGLQTSRPSPVATPKTFESQVPCCCRQRVPLCQDTPASPTPFSPGPPSLSSGSTQASLVPGASTGVPWSRPHPQGRWERLEAQAGKGC